MFQEKNGKPGALRVSSKFLPFMLKLQVYLNPNIWIYSNG
jgi:hypothetical protein